MSFKVSMEDITQRPEVTSDATVDVWDVVQGGSRRLGVFVNAPRAVVTSESARHLAAALVACAEDAERLARGA